MKINKQQLLEEVKETFNYYKKSDKKSEVIQHLTSDLTEEDIFFGIYNGLLLKYNLIKDTKEEEEFWNTFCDITAIIEVLDRH